MGKNNKILLIEDDVFVIDVYRTKLVQENFEVVSAENGLKAMEKLEEFTPDVILLDIMMPYMDGKDVLKKIKDNEKWKDIPVIILTNLSQKNEVEEFLDKGVSDYLIKSHFTPSEVVSKIRTLFENKNQK